ncbi:MAG: DUF3800 domain-containing protein [Chitinophagaceae bacterium]
MESEVFLDESGDLGWKFSHPYRQGGSSRFITIGFLCCPVSLSPVSKRLVRDFYKRFDLPTEKEIKATQLKAHHKDFICEETVSTMTEYPQFHLGAITTSKENVPLPVRSDPNTLYNYVIGQSVRPRVQDHKASLITRDNRTVKPASDNSCIDYLKTLAFLHFQKSVILIDNPVHSHTNSSIIFIDWITHFIWAAYEDEQNIWHNRLKPSLKEHCLYF